MTLLSFSEDAEEKLGSFWNLYEGREDAGGGGTTAITLPEGNGDTPEVLINSKLAKKLKLAEGDELTVITDEQEEYTVLVGGIFSNYMQNYVLMKSSEVEKIFQSPQDNVVLVNTDHASAELSESIASLRSVESVTDLASQKAYMDDTMSSLNYLIWIIVAFSAVLEFIVILNMTSINIAERKREIATVEVLGFTSKETSIYVLQENIFLAFFGGLIGLVLGKLLHHLIVARVLVAQIDFPSFIVAGSYVAALILILTVFFSFVINRRMKGKIQEIPMAESLKAAE